MTVLFSPIHPNPLFSLRVLLSQFIGYSTPSSSTYNPSSLPTLPTGGQAPSLHTPCNPPNRVLLKKQKAAVEETEEADTGETPKVRSDEERNTARAKRQKYTAYYYN